MPGRLPACARGCAPAPQPRATADSAWDGCPGGMWVRPRYINYREVVTVTRRVSENDPYIKTILPVYFYVVKRRF